jgi:hypothetical protein
MRSPGAAKILSIPRRTLTLDRLLGLIPFERWRRQKGELFLGRLRRCCGPGSLKRGWEAEFSSGNCRQLRSICAAEERWSPPSRNVRTSRANAAGLSMLDEWDALGTTARRTSLIAVASPSRRRWNEAGERSPAISSVGASIASASPRANGARVSLIWPMRVRALSRSICFCGSGVWSQVPGPPITSIVGLRPSSMSPRRMLSAALA